MVHYITPAYLQPFIIERYYMHYCSHKEKIATCILGAIIAFGAVTAVYTLVTIYFGA